MNILLIQVDEIVAIAYLSCILLLLCLYPFGLSGFYNDEDQSEKS